MVFGGNADIGELKALLSGFVKFSETAFGHLRQDVQGLRAEIKGIEGKVMELEEKLVRSEPVVREVDHLVAEVDELKLGLANAQRSLQSLEQWKQEAEHRHQESESLIRSKLIEYAIAGLVLLLVSGFGVVVLQMTQDSERDRHSLVDEKKAPVIQGNY